MKTKSKISEYFMQLILVVAGVFFGILASDWNASKNLEKKQEEILINIKEEIGTNLKMIRQADSNRRQFYKSLDSLDNVLTKAEEDELFFDKDFQERLPNWRGIGGGQLSNAMFEMAKYSNILSTLELDKVKQLAKTYNFQNTYNKTRATFLENFYKINSTSTYRDVLRQMWAIRQELGGYEFVLQKEYTKTLEML